MTRVLTTRLKLVRHRVLARSAFSEIGASGERDVVQAMKIRVCF
jgi:hypothetical protein